jgi:O-antigen/teichoic acid export membrane protein
MGNLYYLATGILLGASATGQLRVAHSLLGFTNIFFQGIENVLPIQSSRKFVEGGVTALNRYLIKVALLGSVATAIIDGFFVIFPLPALTFFFGNSYASAAPVVQWTALAEIFFFLTLPAMVWLRTVEQTKRIFYAYVASSVASIVVAYPAISYFGLTGAAIGIFIVTVVNCATLVLGIRSSLSKLVKEPAHARNEKATPAVDFHSLIND